MWKDKVIQELQKQSLFEDSDHLSRFKELMDCYYRDPFFTPGLVKCMYLSCFDDSHFLEMLSMLNQMKYNSNIGLDDMAENGELMVEEKPLTNYEHYVIMLSCAFIENQEFDLSSLPSDLDLQGLYLIRQALKAAAIIDMV